MSEASDKGKRLERQVASLLRKKLGAQVHRDPRSGAGAFHKTDVRDWYAAVPFSIEVKNQKTIKLPEWWRQAEAGAGYRQPPAVVFTLDEQVLATVRLADLIDLLAELGEQRRQIEALRLPVSQIPVIDHRRQVGPYIGETFQCRNGHLTTTQGKCNIKGCPFSHGYRSKKVPRHA